ncbi:hypothetical protein CAPTEDRAFT_221772 [Capitella teleta]|uniref:Uncharacterized protein n=1 Tax=Capitella teleta TaxID=283909 RepID=R7T6L3_CAPTE|nr:hypothetical protein CAPTEDRAFT_221772 [Capitella teleta]|eukprot:ELT89140.1 hypothetical protein CAPTEDRAFT_221772 [Capitella teleta]
MRFQLYELGCLSESQINIHSVEDLDCFHEEILGVPLLLRIWAEFQRNDYVGSAQNDAKFEGDLALLVDTSHPMIRPELEKALDRSRKILQSRGKFCLQIDFGPAIDVWLKANYPQPCCTIGSIRPHKAQLYITNMGKPVHCFDCNALWCLFLGMCWMFSAPCYKIYRSIKCTDIIISPSPPIIRRTILPSGKIVEVTRYFFFYTFLSTFIHKIICFAV